MKSLLVLSHFLALSFLKAGMPLYNLVENDKPTCIERLNEANDAELWNVFLGIQADLFFDHEVRWIEQETWWSQAQRVLEIGSGNGAYLSRLAGKFQEKTFQGIEKLPLLAKQSNESYAGPDCAFKRVMLKFLIRNGLIQLMSFCFV